MITCPKCTQQNPPENRFCQYCGASLVLDCLHCGTTVTHEQLQCEECGGWLVPTLTGLVLAGEPEKLINASFLDMQERYRISPPPAQREQVLMGLPLIDTHPDELSYLEQVLEQEAESLQTLEQTDKEGLTNPQLWLQMGIPAIARHYLVLQDSPLGFPLLHDAWMSAEHQVIVIENLEYLESLTEYVGGSDCSYGQIMRWIVQMAKMWQELDRIECRSTLLRLDNLYLDENSQIVLQKLIEDDPEEPPALVELTSLWQILFALATHEEYTELNAIVEQTKQGEITAIAELFKALKPLASQTLGGETTMVQGTVQQSAQEEFPGEDDWENRSEFQEDSEEDRQLSAAEQPTVANLDQMSYGSESDEQPTVVLPMHLLNLEDAGLSDIGIQRDHNEDYFGIQTKIEKQENILGKQVKGRGLYIVCDGMGGHAAGEVASALSVETLQTHLQKQWKDKLPDEAAIKQAIWKTNQTIYDINLKNARSGSGRMGTTLVMLMVQDNRVAIAHVGDSRIYRISRKFNLEQLTTDHEVGQREIQKGVEPEIAYGRADAYQLTQAIGPRDNSFVEPDIKFIDVNEDSLFLLCSDGLSDNNLLESAWEKYLLPLLSSRANLDQGAKELIELANQHNGHDNITAVLVRVKVRPNLEGQPIL